MCIYIIAHVLGNRKSVSAPAWTQDDRLSSGYCFLLRLTRNQTVSARPSRYCAGACSNVRTYVHKTASALSLSLISSEVNCTARYKTKDMRNMREKK
jgi:hypothetical protein